MPQVTKLLYSLRLHRTKFMIGQEMQIIIFALEFEITLLKLSPVSPPPQEEEVTMC